MNIEPGLLHCPRDYVWRVASTHVTDGQRAESSAVLTRSVASGIAHCEPRVPTQVVAGFAPYSTIL
jgi:hypothetical protein